MSTIVDIYRSKHKEGLYLYVKKDTALKSLPASVMQSFGHAEKAMTLLLTADKTLARANAVNVLEALDNKGLYLQLPPVVGVEC